jgi:hypothetical protein
LRGGDVSVGFHQSPWDDMRADVRRNCAARPRTQRRCLRTSRRDLFLRAVIFLVRGTSRQNWTVRNKLGGMGKMGNAKNGVEP